MESGTGQCQLSPCPPDPRTHAPRSPAACLAPLDDLTRPHLRTPKVQLTWRSQQCSGRTRKIPYWHQ
eukprot:14116593-Alexandrium_andersonii.AAC.1